MISQELVARFVLLNSFGEAMLKAIEFDGKLCGGAVKIQYVIAGHVLAAEFEASELSSSQCPPKLLFFFCLIAAQVAGDLLEGHAGMM